MNNLTLLLPLKDRAGYTKIWLEQNLRSNCDYLIADGSIGDENEAILSGLRLPNLQYLRCSKDVSVECFVEKMLKAVSEIKTQYVMTCDNDDFINYYGITQCISALESDPKVVCAGGPIYKVLQNERNSVTRRYSMPLKSLDAAKLHNRSGFDALTQVSKTYRYMWYSVFRTACYQNIWLNIKKLEISNIFLVEMLQTELTFCYGKYAHVNANHYIRLANPEASWAQSIALNNTPHAYKIFFDQEYRLQVLKISAHVAKRLDVELPQFLDELMSYYISEFNKRSKPIYSRIYARLIRLHEIILRKLHIGLSIRQCISYINFICRMRGALRI